MKSSTKLVITSNGRREMNSEVMSSIKFAVKITGDAGTIEKGDLDNPKIDDLLDDLGELVTKMGGNVMVNPTR